MSPDDRRRAYRKDLLLASAMVAAGLGDVRPVGDPAHGRPQRLRRWRRRRSRCNRRRAPQNKTVGASQSPATRRPTTHVRPSRRGPMPRRRRQAPRPRCRRRRPRRRPRRSRKGERAYPGCIPVRARCASCRFYSLDCSSLCCRIVSRISADGTSRQRDEDRRCQANRLFDAADQPVVSAGALSVLQPRIFRHHLPDRSGGARRRGAGAARSHRSRSSNTNSSACPTQPASATTPKPGR